MRAGIAPKQQGIADQLFANPDGMNSLAVRAWRRGQTSSMGHPTNTTPNIHSGVHTCITARNFAPL